MSRSTFSANVFAVYLMIVGTLLIIAPNRLLGMFGMPVTNEAWIRLVGVLAINLAAFIRAAARIESRYLLQISVGTRVFFFAVATTLVLIGIAPAMLLLFAVIDLCGAGWTLLALHADARCRH